MSAIYRRGNRFPIWRGISQARQDICFSLGPRSLYISRPENTDEKIKQSEGNTNILKSVMCYLYVVIRMNWQHRSAPDVCGSLNFKKKNDRFFSDDSLKNMAKKIPMRTMNLHNSLRKCQLLRIIREIREDFYRNFLEDIFLEDVFGRLSIHFLALSNARIDCIHSCQKKVYIVDPTGGA